MKSQLFAWFKSQDMDPSLFVVVLVTLMVAILFIQSGLDKVLDWKGNKDYFTDHFKNSALKGMAPLLLPIITLTELLAGFLSAIGIVTLLVWDNPDFGMVGTFFGALSIVMLFFGQRLAKDYAGAAVLVPYFLLNVLGLVCYAVLIR